MKKTDPIEVVPYDPNWPTIFETEATKIKQALGNNCIAIHHVGSTSVPGLAAKPIIDIVPVVRDILALKHSHHESGLPRSIFVIPISLVRMA